MALLFFDSFDHYGDGGDLVGLGKWDSTGSTSGAATNVLARTGGFAARWAVTGDTISKAYPASGGIVVGFALQLAATVTTPANDLLQVREGTTVHLALSLTTGNVFTIKRGATVLATGTTALALDNWYYIELKATIHDTTGSYEVRIDTVAELTASGVDTRNGGATGQWDRVRIAGQISGNFCYVDDFYLCDTSGSAPRNTFLGPVKVEALLPLTDAVAAGSNAGLTPSTGTDHGALVDETVPNTTDYNSASSVGAKDTYHYPSLTLTGTIVGIQTNLYVAKSDATARQVCAVVRAGGVDYDGANVSPLTTFSYLSEVRAQNPNTGTEWTTSDITSLEAGMKVTV
jgi:hypothetical protein